MNIDRKSQFGDQPLKLVRDFLYSRMRGVQDHPASPAPAAGGTASGTSLDVVVSALRQVSADLRAVRELIEKRERGRGD